MAFPVIKKLELDYLGEGWKGAYINFSGLSFADTRKFSQETFDTSEEANPENLDKVLELIKSHFLDGKAFDGKGLVDLTKDNLEELPTDVITKSMELLAALPDPKS